VGSQGESATKIRALLDAIGQHWFPTELDTFLVGDRELKGWPPSKACLAAEFLKVYYGVRGSEFKPGSGRVIDMSGDFFKLSILLDWLMPNRDGLKKNCERMDAALIDVVKEHCAKAAADSAWLDDNLPALADDQNKPGAFARTNLMRQLVVESKQYALKKGDGLDFSHAVIGSAYGTFATLDKHWKRRVESLPQPNTMAKIYYEPQLDQLVSDIEVALTILKNRK